MRIGFKTFKYQQWFQDLKDVPIISYVHEISEIRILAILGVACIGWPPKLRDQMESVEVEGYANTATMVREKTNYISSFVGPIVISETCLLVFLNLNFIKGLK